MCEDVATNGFLWPFFLYFKVRITAGYDRIASREPEWNGTVVSAGDLKNLDLQADCIAIAQNHIG